MPASFPGSVVTNPTTEVVAGSTVKSAHVESLFLEVVALEQSILGTLGANRTFKPASNAGVPLIIQGVASQSADLLQIGSSASVNDRLFITTGGQVNVVQTGLTAGTKYGSGGTAVQVYTTGANDLRIKPVTDSTGAVRVRNAADGATALRVDTTNLRVGIGTETTPDTLLHLSPGTDTTTAVFGIKFGTDAAATFYRSAVGVISMDGGLAIGTTLTVASSIGLSGASFDTTPGSTYTGTTPVTLRATDFEVRNSSVQTRLILSSSNGTRYALRVDDNAQLIVEAA
jgi:hypothetical protein